MPRAAGQSDILDEPQGHAFADLVLRNGRIYTLDPSGPWAECVAIRHGAIIAIGTPADVASYIGPATAIGDLGGRLVLPGFIDAHCHVFEGARSQLFEIAITPSTSLPELIDIIGTAARQPGRAWISGGAWGPALADEFATEAARQALDQVSAGRPVALRDMSFHSRIANAAALAAAGIGSDTPDPANGTIVRDPTSGQPTGLLHEAAAFHMDSLMPWSQSENFSAARHSIKLFNSLGVTGFHLAVASRTTLSIYKAIDDTGDLTARVTMSIAMEETPLAQARDGIGPDVIANRKAFASQRIGVDFAKFFMDGVPSMGTAAFIDPYLAHPSGKQMRGHSFHTVTGLAEQVAPLDRDGISVKIHATGDQAVRDTLDAIALVRKRNGAHGPQHQIAHLPFIATADLPRLRALNVVADLCPPMWFPSIHMQTMRRLAGDDRVERSWPIRTLLELGTDATAGTDWPAISPSPSPWPGLASLITRQNPYTSSPETHAPHEAIDLPTALTLFTSRPARAMRIDDRAGSLQPGKSADMIILDRDIFTIAPQDIAGTQVLATLFEGQCVHGSLSLS